MDEIVIFVTVESEEQARVISMKLLECNLIACANIIPGVKSLYWWEGKIEESGELLLVIKSKKYKLDDIVDAVKKNHSYSVPEVIALPVVGGNPDYLKWLGDSLCKKPCSGQ